MVKILLGLTLLISTAAWVSCQTKQFSGSQLPDRQIWYGRGGGFSGKETTWILLENGQLFRQEGIGSTPIQAGKISSYDASQLFKEADLVLYGENNLTEIGNTYAFIGMKDKHRSVRLVWSGKLPEMNPKLADLINGMEKIAK